MKRSLIRALKNLQRHARHEIVLSNEKPWDVCLHQRRCFIKLPLIFSDIPWESFICTWSKETSLMHLSHVMSTNTSLLMCHNLNLLSLWASFRAFFLCSRLVEFKGWNFNQFLSYPPAALFCLWKKDQRELTLRILSKLIKTQNVTLCCLINYIVSFQFWPWKLK